MPFIAIYPLKQAVEEYGKLVRIRELHWSQSWLPVFHFGLGKGYYVVLGDQEEKQTSPILDVPPVNEPVVLYPSLTNMMMKAADSYRTGLYYVDEYSGDLLSDE